MARVRPMMLLPPVVFVGLFGFLLGELFWGNPDELPSAIIGKPAPRVPEETLPGKTQLTDADLRTGEITIVNYWASWCPPCRAEHPTLIQLAEDGFRVAAINLADDPENALAYLAEETDPFFAHGVDPNRRVSIDWGVAAPPETFIVDGDGTVLFRFAGPLVGSDYEQRFLPALRAAVDGAG